MSEAVIDGKSESLNNEIQNLLSATTTSQAIIPATTTVQSSSEMSKDVSNETLLKTLLSTSTALSSPIIVPLSTAKISTVVPIESMITKEVNDTQLNLKKILYEPEKEAAKEKDQEVNVQNTTQKVSTDTQTVDDDDRLVIDISDDENDGQKKKKRKSKSMPILENDSQKSKNAALNRMPSSITYSLETSGANNSCVKIDILASTSNYSNSSNSSTSEMSKLSTSSSKHLNVSLTDELNILSHEIDKQMNKKTNEILELIKEYLGSSINELEFLTKLNTVGSISVSDLSLIAKKLIKRYKFEANPNYRDFMRMKSLQFPTGSNDLINYFKNLLPTMNKEKFVQMIKFYEIIVKEMFNLNKTKTLQYLIDFMIKRKNAQLDLLNFNYETNASPNLKEKKVTSTSSTFEMPDSTQNMKNDRKNIKLRDTSYNFVIRSDPIYLTAGSTFMTNHRDVIKCRSTSCVQTHTFERRPFDNNILKGRRVVRRITNGTNEEERTQIRNEPINSLSQYKAPEVESKSQIVKMTEIATIQPTIIDDRLTKAKYDNIESLTSKASKIECGSPILVESDTASSSPPIHTIIKPQVLTQPILHRTFNDRHPQVAVTTIEQKIEFPKLTSNGTAPVSQQLKQSTPIKESAYPIINGQISINEIKTLNLNGTEIIPTSILRNTITARRKTIDVDHPPSAKSSMEVKKIAFQTVKSVPATMGATTLDFSHRPKEAAQKILKRRQSCHERIFVPTTTAPSNIGKNFIDFMNSEYETKKREAEVKRIQSQQCDEEKLVQLQNSKLSEAQKPPTPIYAQPKRVRFMQDESIELRQQSPQMVRSQNAQKVDEHFQHSFYRNSLIQSPAKFASTIDYQRYQMYFERELRERGYVDPVEPVPERESSSLCTNRPLELVSHVPPERYLQSSEANQPTAFTSPKQSRAFDKVVPRAHQRTPIMTNDEKATLVAYHQLQSLHRDPSNLTAQQYSEHLKQIHQLKQLQASSYSPSKTYHQDHPNQLLDGRENYYKNTQPQDNSGASARPAYHYASRDVVQVPEAEKEHQSLQRKLKFKAKSSKYIEPSQLPKLYHNTPRSTYYPDPYASTAHKKPPTPIYSQPERPIEQHSQEQLTSIYHLRNESALNTQMQYQCMLAQAQQQQQQQHHHYQHQQQQHQNLLNHNQPARPIPRPAIPSSYVDGKLNGIPSSHNIYSHNPLQAFSNQQSEFYRHLFHPKSF